MTVLRRLFAVCVVPLLASCDSSPIREDPGKTYGMITIGSPSVDTRERLINDRIEQQKWLEDQLAAAATADFSANASRSRRSVSAFSAGANVNLDPAGMDAWRRSREMEDAELAYKKQLADLDYQLLRRKKQLALENAQAETDASKIEATAPADLPRASAPTADKVTQEQLGAGAGTGKGLVEAMTAALAPASDAKPISTPIDTFRDRLALREEIRTEMIANNLDDRHDLRGNALYRLKFDATVLPANDTSAYAVISVCIQPTTDFYVTPDKPNQASGARRCDAVAPGTHKSSNTDTSPRFQATDGQLLEHAILRDIRERMEQVTADYEEHGDSKYADIEDSPGLSVETRAYFQAGAEAFLRAVDTMKAAKVGQEKAEQEKAAQAAAAAAGKAYVRKRVTKEEAASLTKQSSVFSSSSRNYVARQSHRPLIQPERPERGNGANVWIGKTFVEEACGIEHDPPDVPRAGIIGTDPRLFGAICDGEGFDRIKAVHRYMAHLGVMLDAYDSLGGGNRWKSNEDFVKDYRSKPDQSAMYYGADAVTLNLRLTDLVNVGLRRSNLELYAYGGTPRESVERIADIVTRREAFQLALGLQTLAGNAGISALTNYMRGSEGVFAALRRQPLVVGFGHNNVHASTSGREREFMPPADFGWVIGPRYGATSDGKQASFRQSLVQHGLSAVISVPGWWDRVELVVRRYWVNEAGEILSTAGATTTTVTDPYSDTNASVTLKTKTPYRHDEHLTYTISLPESIDSILSLLESKPEMAPEPHRLDEALWTVKNGSPAEILIRGAHLWRNPQVRLGGQPATNIRVLPDMRGIVAEFAKIDKDVGGGPALKINRKSIPANSLPVTLTTTNGFRMVGFATVVTDAPKTENLRASAPALLFGDAANSFKLNVALTGYHGLTSVSREAGTASAFTADAQGWESRSDRELLYKPKKLAAVKAGDKLEMQVLLLRKKGEEPERVFVSGNPIYYPSAAHWRVQAKVGSRTSEKLDGEDVLSYRIELTVPAAYADVMGLQDNVAVFEAVGYPLKSSPTCVLVKAKAGLSCTISISVRESPRVAEITLRPAGKPDGVPDPFKEAIKLN